MRKKSVKKKPKKTLLRNRLDKEWSLYVRNRDKVCQKCGSTSKTLAAHHAFGRRHLATRWDVFNGISLCFACHINWAHRDPSGFSEWFREHIGDDQFNRLSEAHTSVVKLSTQEMETILDVLTEMNQ